LSQKEINSILENYRIVAVVGLSSDPTKASYRVAAYLQSAGYRIIPVNPFVDEVLGEKSYKSLLHVPEAIEIVDIFRPSDQVSAVVEEAIELMNRLGTPKVIWMQSGIVNEEAARRAKAAGFKVVMDRCMMMEHKRVSMENVLDS